MLAGLEAELERVIDGVNWAALVEGAAGAPELAAAQRAYAEQVAPVVRLAGWAEQVGGRVAVMPRACRVVRVHAMAGWRPHSMPAHAGCSRRLPMFARLSPSSNLPHPPPLACRGSAAKQTSTSSPGCACRRRARLQPS